MKKKYKVFQFKLNGKHMVKVPVAWVKTLEEARKLLDEGLVNGLHLCIEHV